MMSRPWNFAHKFPNILLGFEPVYVFAGVPGTTVFLVRIDSTEHEDRFSVRKEQRVVEKIAIFVGGYYAIADPLRAVNLRLNNFSFLVNVGIYNFNFKQTINIFRNFIKILAVF